MSSRIPIIVETMMLPASEDTRSDIALLERVVGRDQRALAELYDRHSRVIFGLLLRILKDRAEAEEVLQEAFLAVWTRADTYHDALGSPIAWIVGIARNRGIDRLRATGARARLLDAADPPNPIDSPESLAVRGERKRGVASALAALPAEQRQLIEDAYFLGLTHSELARRFSLPLGTVKTRVRAGMLALRDQLEHLSLDHG